MSGISRRDSLLTYPEYTVALFNASCDRLQPTSTTLNRISGNDNGWTDDWFWGRAAINTKLCSVCKTDGENSGVLAINTITNCTGVFKKC